MFCNEIEDKNTFTGMNEYQIQITNFSDFIFIPSKERFEIIPEAF